MAATLEELNSAQSEGGPQALETTPMAHVTVIRSGQGNVVMLKIGWNAPDTTASGLGDTLGSK
jgi:hypothetical protein